MTWRVGILTVSDRASRGERPDESGPLLKQLLVDHLQADTQRYQILPDDQAAIEACLTEWCDELGLDLILTTGGTGFAPRDVSPEATRAVIQREAPGLVEAMRAASLSHTPHAMLSRAVAGIRGRTLIVNLPGSPTSVRENFAILLPALPHALNLLQGEPGEESAHRPP